MSRDIDRRKVLKRIGGVSIFALAGCAGGGGGGSDGGGGDGGGGSGGSTDTATETEDGEQDTVKPIDESFGSDDDEDDGESTETTTATESGDTSGSADTFEYTFASDDAVVDSSLNGIELSYPDGSGAVSDASVASASLAGEDVTGDISSESASDDGDTMTVSLGGNFQISAEDQLMLELSGVSVDTDSYSVTVTVNPQSGATEFSQSF